MPSILIPAQRLSIVPPGAEVELVDRNSPLLKQNPLVIEGQRTPDAIRTAQKISDYQARAAAYNGIGGQAKDFGTFSSADSPIQAIVQELYSENETRDKDYAQGVESAVVAYPTSMQAKIDSLLLKCPPRLWVPGTNGDESASGRAVHVQGREGTKSLAVLLYPMNIRDSEGDLFVYLYNPRDPAWVVYAPNDGPPMSFDYTTTSSRSKDESERNAWRVLERLLRSVGLNVEGTQYPNGSDRFPDYVAYIEGQEVDVEITSVPDLGPWTIKSHYRDFESKCQDIAESAGETKSDVLADAERVIANKEAILSRQIERPDGRKCFLLIDNRSTVDVVNEEYWTSRSLSTFALVAIIERGAANVVHCDKDVSRLVQTCGGP